MDDDRTLHIGYFIGSASKDSINRKLAHGLIDLAGDRFTFEEIPITQLPLHDRDRDADPPTEVVELKAAIRRSNGLMFVTPEYNRSVPGILKNAIDWGSRPYGDSAFTGIPAAVIGASPGGIGTAMAQQHLRNILAYLDVPTLGQPEAFVQYTSQRFAEDGSVQDEDTREFLTTFLEAFERWVRTNARATAHAS